jgi:hypothetical protein
VRQGREAGAWQGQRAWPAARLGADRPGPTACHAPLQSPRGTHSVRNPVAAVGGAAGAAVLEGVEELEGGEREAGGRGAGVRGGARCNKGRGTLSAAGPSRPRAPSAHAHPEPVACAGGSAGPGRAERARRIVRGDEVLPGKHAAHQPAAAVALGSGPRLLAPGAPTDFVRRGVALVVAAGRAGAGRRLSASRRRTAL